jgi:alpha-1,6-mannosyltransferase
MAGTVPESRHCSCNTNAMDAPEHVLLATPSSSVRGAPHLVDATMFWSSAGGGVARYLRDKHRWALREAGWQHTFVVPGACETPGVCIGGVRLPFSGGYRFPLLRQRHAHLLAALEPDVIEAGDPYCLAWSALDAAARCGSAVATFCHSNLIAEAQRWFGGPGRVAARTYLRRLLRRFDLVMAASRWMVNEMRELGLDNVVHQPLGVDLEHFNPSRRSAQWRRELDLADDAIVLAYVGRFAPEKNLDLLVEMVDTLGEPYVLVAQGAGPCPPRGRRVRVLPYSADPRDVAVTLASADVFVHAGTRETFGLAALEALACGTPVVLPASAGFLDLIDGRAAIGVGGSTAGRLAEGVRALRDQSPQALRQYALKAAGPFDQRRTFGRQFERYAALMRRRPQPARIGELRRA